MERQKEYLKELVFLIIVWSAAIVQAEPLDEEQARQAAATFFSSSASGSRLKSKGLQQPALRLQMHENGYYVFDRSEGGCVFVADDDAIGHTILGYTDQGNFDAENLPAGLRDWLDQVAVLMDAVHEGKIAREKLPVRKAHQAVVEPLIKTTWNQREPYNNLCPVVDGERCLTGCVATAMAQVMKYWEWPKHGYGSVKYTDENGCGQTLSQDFSQNYYEWDKMLDNYSRNDTSAQATAVATLMRDCGYAVKMSYTPQASGGYVSAQTMQTYFHYSLMAKVRLSNNYPEETWHEFLRQDLREKRPVLYVGHGKEGGHQFIIDGFDSDGYYHVNWGWGGYQDGWFILTNLDRYNDNQRMINNLMPDYNEEDDFSYTLIDSVLTITGTGMMPLKYQFNNAPWKTRMVGKIVIGEGITGIIDDFGWGNGNYYNLKEVVLPEGLEYIGEYAFYSSQISSVNIPSTVVCMDYAFEGCRNLKSLHLPASLKFYYDYLPNVEELTVDEDNAWLKVEDNILYSKDGRSLLLVPQRQNRITIAESTEGIFDNYILKYGIPIISKCKKAPDLPEIVTDTTYSYINKTGYLFIPCGSTGYDSWKEILPPGWIILTYADIRDVPDTNVTWTLDDEGTLSMRGWGVLKSDEYELSNAPYYNKRYQIKKLIVNEGILQLCSDAYWRYNKMTEAEFPSTLSYIAGGCFAHTALTSITCQATIAPTLETNVFEGVPENGMLRVPEGADYSTWLAALPSGWKIEYFTPESFATSYLYTGEERKVQDLREWDKLLEEHPNSIGIINPKRTEYASLMYNMLVEDVSEAGSYLCPYLLLSDLTNGFGSTDKAPRTGFTTPVSFTIKKGEYTRLLKSGYNTVCLPFDISEEILPEGCKMYTYSHFDADKGDVIFAPQSEIEAGRACFVTSRTDTLWQTNLSGKVVVGRQASLIDANTRGTFVTTDEYKGIGYAPRDKDDIFAPLGQYLHPFRACLFINTSNAPSEVRVRISDSDVTEGIRGIVEIPTETSDIYYSLDGKRLSSPKKGQPYIKNHKIVIK